MIKALSSSAVVLTAPPRASHATEIIAFSDRAAEFDALNCSVVAASTDTPESHLAWIRTPRKKGGLGRMQIPIVADIHKVRTAAPLFPHYSVCF